MPGLLLVDRYVSRQLADHMTLSDVMRKRLQPGSDAPLCPPQPVTLYGSSVLGGAVPAGQPLEVEGASQPGVVTNKGLVLTGSDGKAVSSRAADRELAPALLQPLPLLHRCW